MSVLTIFIIIFTLWQIQFSDVTAIISILTSSVIAIAAVTGLVFYFWRVKSYEQCKEDLAREKTKNAELKEEAATAKQKKIEALEEKAKAELFCAEITKQLGISEGKLNRSIQRELECREEHEKEIARIRGEYDRIHRSQ